MNNIPTYGLVVCGGQSTRMGTDKSMLNYHGIPQRYYLYDMLERICGKAFISCNTLQAATIPDRFSVFVDAPEYQDIGPMGALLTAFMHEQEANFLVVGCDYPLLTVETLQRLYEVSLQTNKTTTIYNSLASIYEPLISVYQSFIKAYLNENFMQNDHSIQSVLRRINPNVIAPYKYMEIMSIDTEEEYENALTQLRIMKNKQW